MLEQETNINRPEQYYTQRTLCKEDWILAIIKGADDRSPRSRHVLVLAGLLLGFEGQGRHGLTTDLSKKLGQALVQAVNMTLQDDPNRNAAADQGLAVALTQVIDLLRRDEKVTLDHNLLLPALVRTSFLSQEGLHQGYFLSAIDASIVEGAGQKFEWPTKSATYLQVQRMSNGPLIAGLGSMSRLIAFSIENATSIDSFNRVLQDISQFARSMCIQWRQNKLSEIDISEESVFLGEETLRASLPLLWRVLKSGMFAVVVILRSFVGQILGSPCLGQNES